MAKKALIILAVFFSMLFVSVNKVSAQDSPWGPKISIEDRNAYTEAINQNNCATPSLECLVHLTSRFVAIEWVNDAVYSSGPPIVQSGDAGGVNSLAGRSFVGGMAYLMGEMYRFPAARTSVYVADVLENARVISPAYAQGLGFASLNPILGLWKTFRNIAYMAFVFIFVILGFMIMFRQKIGGQSAVTAQQAIPSVIVSLLFVTFSYAIAGFLIDLMYLLMFMIIGVFGQTANGLDGGIIDYNILNLVSELFNDVAGFDSNIDIVSNLLGSLLQNEAFSNIAGLVGGITLSLVLAVAILIGTFKLFFELLKSYATIVLSVVTAPLVLLGGAFPGNNAFTPWVKNLIANLSAFPTVLMTVILFYQFTSESPTTGGFLPPFLLGRGQTGAITTLMGLAIILALPEIVKEVKKKLGATDGFGTMVTNAASARAKSGLGKAENAIPIASGAVGGAVGAGLALRQGRKEGLRGRQLLSGMARGVTVTDDQGRKRVVGGIGRLGGRAYAGGQSVRKYIDRAAEGRLMDAEDPAKLLSRLAERRKPQEKIKEPARPNT